MGGLLGLALSTLAIWTVSQASAQTSDSAYSPFVGAYRLDGPTKQSEDVVDHAITRGTSSMGPVKRMVARKRLHNVNATYRTVRIVQEGALLVTDFEGRQYRAPLDGTARRQKDPDGKSVDVSYRVEGDTLHARYKGEDGEKRIDFVLGADGRTLTYEVTMVSGQLPGPIRYQITYTRS